MKRVMIIGCGGSGKSTLARQLGEKTGLPVVHLDQIWWAPGNWKHTSREEFDEILKAEMEKPQWIMDGNYNRTLELRLERADTVVYLDYSWWVCLFSWMKRVITNWGKARPDMAPGCAEWFDPEMAGWIWDFNMKNRKRYREILSAQTGKVIHIFKNRRKLMGFWACLERNVYRG